MLLNCDLGERDVSESPALDALAMPHIDQANVACGFHAGSALTMRETVNLAAQHGVAIGAHPSYPDREGFGRRSMPLSSGEIIATVHYQVAALEGMARSLGMGLTHVKPHGALYNDMMSKPPVRAAILEAMASYHQPLTLVLQATSQCSQHREEASAAGVHLLFEAFADRRYNDDGTLLSRSKAQAVLGREHMLAQVEQLHNDGTVTTASGKLIPIEADTLCVHGDNPEGIHAIASIRALLSGG